MPYVREQIHGTSGQDIMKINENFMSIFEKVFGDINFSDTDEALQKSILTQYIPFQGDGNLDKNYPLTIRFYVPPNVKKVNKASLNVFLENYRMDSDITEGGGGVAGGSVSLSVASGGGYSNSLSQGSSTSYVKKWGSGGLEYTAPTRFISTESTAGRITSSDGRVRFIYDTNYPDPTLGVPTETTIPYNNGSSTRHSYLDMMMLQHSHEIPAHSHSISIEPHTHSGSASVTIPSHHHSLKEGIRVSTTAPGTTTISVNGTNVCSVSASKVSENDVDITSYIKVGEWNIIKVSTTNLARISVYGTIEAIMRLT